MPGLLTPPYPTIAGLPFPPEASTTPCRAVSTRAAASTVACLSAAWAPATSPSRARARLDGAPSITTLSLRAAMTLTGWPSAWANRPCRSPVPPSTTGATILSPTSWPNCPNAPSRLVSAPSAPSSWAMLRGATSPLYSLRSRCTITAPTALDAELTITLPTPGRQWPVPARAVASAALIGDGLADVRRRRTRRTLPPAERCTRHHHPPPAARQHTPHPLCLCLARPLLARQRQRAPCPPLCPALCDRRGRGGRLPGDASTPGRPCPRLAAGQSTAPTFLPGCAMRSCRASTAWPRTPSGSPARATTSGGATTAGSPTARATPAVRSPKPWSAACTATFPRSSSFPSSKPPRWMPSAIFRSPTARSPSPMA